MFRGAAVNGAIAGLVCMGIGVVILETLGPYWLFGFTALVVGPIIAHCVYVRIKRGFWPDY